MLTPTSWVSLLRLSFFTQLITLPCRIQLLCGICIHLRYGGESDSGLPKESSKVFSDNGNAIGLYPVQLQILVRSPIYLTRNGVLSLYMNWSRVCAYLRTCICTFLQ